MGLRNKLGEKYSKNIVVPKNRYQFTVKKEDLATNPIISVLSEVTDIRLDKDFDYYLRTSELNVTASLRPESLITSITGSKSQGINIQISFELSQFKIKSEGLSLCEDIGVKPLSCGNGLKVSATNLMVSTHRRPVKIKANLKLIFKNDFIKIQLDQVTSNLGQAKGPLIDLTFGDLTIPPVSIVINGQETELDTSHIKEQILSKKAFLGQKLLDFSADFIAHDLANIINDFLKTKHIGTDVDIYHHGFGFFSDYPFEDVSLKEPSDILKILLDQIQRMIKKASVGLKLKDISLPEKRHLEFSGSLKFVLNDSTVHVGSTIGNSDTELSNINLSKYNSELNLAISEPLLNGALDLINSTGLFHEAFDAIAKEKSISLKNLKVHFSGERKLKLVANIEIDLKKLRTSFWRDPESWAETEIGIWLERNNNNSVIYFPLEFTLSPEIKGQNEGQKNDLSLKMDSVFSEEELINTYGYPSNVKQMFQVVRKGVLTKLHLQFDKLSGKVFILDLQKIFSQNKIQLIPRQIDFDQSSYVVLGFDFDDIR